MLNTTSFRANGAIKQLSYGNGLQLTMTYNANRQQPLRMKVGPNGSGTVLNYSYDYYDANGNNNNRLRKITDNVDSAYTVQYSYDDYNRLSSAQGGAYPGSTYWRGYQYDRFGNLRQVGGMGGPHATYTLNYDNNATGAPATNRIASVTEGTTQAFTYDAAGDLTAGDGMTYAYDGASRLSSVNSGALGQYGYDGDGARVKKVEGGQSVFYVRSSKLGQVAFEVAGTSVQRAYVNVGGKQLALLSTDGQFYWLHLNHINSARALTDVSGNLVYKGQFDPHGQTLTEWSASGNTNLNTKKFTGYERDAATGLDYANARMYAGGRGRFMQPDPMGIAAASLRRPQSLNRYSYVNNDPVNFVDSRGTVCDEVSFAYWTNGGFRQNLYSHTSCDDDFTKAGSSGGGGGGGGEGGGRGGGGGGEAHTNAESRLLDKLRHLNKECVDAFGGQDKINSWIQDVDTGKVQIHAYDNNAAIPNSPRGETVKQYWDRVQPNAIAHTVSYNDWGRGQYDYRTYGTIILGNAYYNPIPEGQTRFALAGGDIDKYKANVLLHEFLHWETNGGHQVIFDKLMLGDRGYNASDPSLALDQFIASGCKDKQN